MDVFDKVREMISDIVGCDKNMLTTETLFAEIDEWDSLAAISLLSSCEKTFNVSISMNKIDKIKTIGDLINAIQK